MNQFNSSSILKKYTIKKNMVLLSKGRLIDGTKLIETGGFDFGDLWTFGLVCRYQFLIVTVPYHTP